MAVNEVPIDDDGFDDIEREDIEINDHLRTEWVNVPEWGKPNSKRVARVLVRELTGSQRDAYEASIVGDRAGKDRRMNYRNMRAKLAALSMVSPKTGQRLYNDNEVGSLGNKSAAALDRVFDVCQRLSGLTDADVKELEEALDENPNENSGTL